MNVVNKCFIFLQGLIFYVLVLTPSFSKAQEHWVGTWGTAPQLVETHNNPPSPGLQNNSLRQIVQVSIGGETVRLKLTNQFSSGPTEIKAVEIAHAKSAGSSSDIDETSTVSLSFNGSSSVTMQAGEAITSDPVPFHLDNRQNVAVTIHYGGTVSSSVSGHPGSRTTSYLKAGNTTDFSNAVKTDHWYNILSLETLADKKAGAVAILGNSITDGRGSTTNKQDRWADVLSRRLLQNPATSHVAVLNMGIGGNCVLRGGLGPAASTRYQRDLLGQEGVKWIILFEAVNDLGGAADGVRTAQQIIDVYKQIIREAHAKGIYVFGATITPFKNNSYYRADHENGRNIINDWMKSTKMLDGVIDFAAAVCNPDDTQALQSRFLFQNDWLHLNADGYQTMGEAIDLNLFTYDGPLAADGDDDSQPEAEGWWIEAEKLVTPTCGNKFTDKADANASNGHSLLSEREFVSAAPVDSADMLVIRFNVKKNDIYHLYARVNCPTWDDDSYWVKLDNGSFVFANGLCTNGSWDWKELGSYQLNVGEHVLTVTPRENGAIIDKFFLTTSGQLPVGMGGEHNFDVNGQGGEEQDAFSSNLPLVMIHTDNLINAEAKVKGMMRIVDNGEGKRNLSTDKPTDYDGFIGVKLRGNSSLSFEQKKYTIETQDADGNDLKTSILGMPEESDWVLLAPYNDISLVRDVFAFNMWTEMGHWAPRYRMCEVFVNDVYQGVYVFCEKIKRDKERVNIEKLKETEIEGLNVTGGYILRIDAFDDGDATFSSKIKGLSDNGGFGGGFGGWPWGMESNTTVTWTVYYPKKEKLKDEQKAYIQDFVDNMEFSFQQTDFDNPKNGYAKWIDVPSFVDYFIHTELSLNADGFKRSAYFFKDRDQPDGTVSKMQAGPVWDYNLAYGNCNFCNANNVEAWVYNGCNTNPTPEFWRILSTDQNFMKLVRQRYAQLRQSVISIDNIDAFFDDYASLLDEAKERHYQKYSNLFSNGTNQNGWMWMAMAENVNPVAFFAGYQVQSYEQEIQTVKDWFRNRIAFLDREWKFDETTKVSHPSQDFFSVDVKMRNDSCFSIRTNRKLAKVHVYDLNGRCLYATGQYAGRNKWNIQLPAAVHQPVIIRCFAVDGEAISRKIR